MKLAEPAAAEDEVAGIENCSLAGSDGALRLAKCHANIRGIHWFNNRRSGCVAMAELDHGLHRHRGTGNRDPIDVARFADGALQLFIFSNDKLISGTVQGDDVHRATRRHAETATLADRIAVQAFVTADDGAIGGHHLAGFTAEFPALFMNIAGDELHVITGGDKADFLAFWLFGNGKFGAARDVANLGLRAFAQRKAGARELLLREAEQKIGLIL